MALAVCKGNTSLLLFSPGTASDVPTLPRAADRERSHRNMRDYSPFHPAFESSPLQFVCSLVSESHPESRSALLSTARSSLSSGLPGVSPR